MMGGKRSLLLSEVGVEVNGKAADGSMGGFGSGGGILTGGLEAVV